MIYSRICSKNSLTGAIVIYSDWKPNSAQFQRLIREKNFQNNCTTNIIYYLETMNVDDFVMNNFATNPETMDVADPPGNFSTTNPKPEEPRGIKRFCTEDDSKTYDSHETKRRCMDRQIN
jgi:hypothetical protein